MVFELIYAVGVVGASLAIYFKFVDKQLDKALDKVFSGWRMQNMKDLEKLREIEDTEEA